MDKRLHAGLVLLGMLAACRDRAGGDATAQGTRDAGSNVTIQAGGSTITVHDGTAGDRPVAVAAAPDATELAAIELYPGATVKSDMSVAAAGKDGKSGIVSFETPDRPAAVIAFYRAAAARAGYHVEGQIDVGGMALLSGRRADGTAFQLSVSRTGETSAATLITGAKG